MEKCTPTWQVVLSLLVHEWSFPVCRYTAAHLFTKVKSSIAAFRPHRTWRSVTAIKREKKQGINITGSSILNWSRDLCAFTSPFPNGIFNSCKYIYNFLCSCNNFSWTILPKRQWNDNKWYWREIILLQQIHIHLYHIAGCCHILTSSSSFSSFSLKIAYIYVLKLVYHNLLHAANCKV